VLTAHRYAGLAIACCNDVVDEARKRGNAADEEGGDSAPITGVFGRIAVHAVEVVHVGYGHITSSDDIVAAARKKRISGDGHCRGGLCEIVNVLSHQNGCHWPQENGISAEESKELRC
jgi:hypothetical protein